MSVSGVLGRGRVAALQLMRDTCVIERKDGEPVLDEETGQLEQPWTTVYTGVCRVKPRSSSETEWGEREVTLAQLVVSLPWDTAPQIQREDRVRVMESEDGWLIGRHLDVVGVSLSGTATARRLLVEDREG
ncbi:hypothetical protein Nocox_36910 [Nonomuraea coxensis DSM 45129]|uniref:Head-to-tail stopper n=1 Tax=Nonomuraea coxensis DSM 45129 TaxID=1122611 RepID=A0ABX8UBW7_9ACTN|nr:DUF6093 family protein [Nonomuraea coxensis]QYC44936.1 hypothetical protein Nocox_36910 [Nonomuraea coxensis DSM 45129]